MKKATDFQVGQRVVLGSGCLHERYRGRAGTVQRTIKGRDVVRVQLSSDRYDTYDANPENVKEES